MEREFAVCGVLVLLAMVHRAAGVGSLPLLRGVAMEVRHADRPRSSRLNASSASKVAVLTSPHYYPRRQYYYVNMGLGEGVVDWEMKVELGSALTMVTPSPLPHVLYPAASNTAQRIPCNSLCSHYPLSDGCDVQMNWCKFKTPRGERGHLVFDHVSFDFRPYIQNAHSVPIGVMLDSRTPGSLGLGPGTMTVGQWAGQDLYICLPHPDGVGIVGYDIGESVVGRDEEPEWEIEMGVHTVGRRPFFYVPLVMISIDGQFLDTGAEEGTVLSTDNPISMLADGVFTLFMDAFREAAGRRKLVPLAHPLAGLTWADRQCYILPEDALSIANYRNTTYNIPSVSLHFQGDVAVGALQLTHDNLFVESGALLDIQAPPGQAIFCLAFTASRTRTTILNQSILRHHLFNINSHPSSRRVNVLSNYC